MDANRFDDVIRSLAASPSRRTVLGLTLGGGLGALLGVVDAAAKKRKGRHKNKDRNKNTKRRCLVGQRRCRDRRCHGCCSDADCGGNECALGVCRDCPRNERLCDGACIPGDACCTSDDCDGAPCERGRCLCADGQRDCHGRCIPEDACCSSSDCGPCETCQNDRCLSVCPEDLECVDGQCRCTASSCDGCCAGDTCRDGDTNKFCGSNGEICAACTVRQTCQGGVCTCPAGEQDCAGECIPEDDCCPGTISCGEACCDVGDDEVCASVGGTDSCQGGGCPETDFCVVVASYLCAVGCVCTTTVDPVAENACVVNPISNPPPCTVCSSSADCGAGEVCIASGQECGEACGAAFCVPRCGEDAFTAAARSGSRSLKDASAVQVRGGKQGNRTRRSHKRGGHKHRR